MAVVVFTVATGEHLHSWNDYLTAERILAVDVVAFLLALPLKTPLLANGKAQSCE
jgi:hypothetical protein